jgi:tight adherence protein B
MQQIAEQQPPPISQEFMVILSEYKMGRPLEDSLMDMYKRINRQEVDLLISAISISRSVGGNLADTLETLAKTLREKAQIEGKIDALTSMGRMQGWVVGLIPVAVMLMLRKQEPEGMNALFNEPIGWITLAGIALLMFIAVMMIRKIVNIDI